MTEMPRARKKPSGSGVRAVGSSADHRPLTIDHRPPTAERPSSPPVRRRLWGAAGLALLIAAGVRLWSAAGVRESRYGRESVAELRAVVAERPGDSVLRVVMGRKLLATGQASEAAAEFRRAAELEPQSTEALTGLGQALAANGQDDEAFGALQLSLAQRPTAAALRTEGQLYLAHHVPEKAVPVLVRAVRLAPGDAQAWRSLAAARAATGQWAAAAAAWARLGALRPGDPAVLTGRAEALIQLGRPAEAEPLLRAALKQVPRSAAAYTLLGSALAAREPADRFAAPAEAAFRQALRLDPASPDAVYGLGLLLLRDGRSREALSLFKELVRLAPGSLQARFQYARALSAAGRTAEADAALREYHRRAEVTRQEMELRGRLTLQPNNPVLRARLARLLRSGENAKARKSE